MLRIAIIGLGYWGPNYARLLAGTIDGLEFVAAADRDENRLRTISRQYPSVLTYTDYREMLAHGGVDAVIVATPATTHREIVEDCLRAGLDVLVEKPISRTVEDAESMIAVAEETGRILMVGHTFLFNPAVQRVKRYIEDGELGRLLYFSFNRTGLGPIRQDVNALWDLAPHDLSMLRYWIGGDPVDVVARGQSYLRRGTEDVVFVTLRYPNDVLAGIHVSWLDPVKDRRVTVVGDRKMVVFDDVNVLEKLRIYDKGASYQPRGGDFGDFVASVRDGDILIPKVENREPLREQLLHFVDCVKTRRIPICDGKEGAAVVWALERAQTELERTQKESIFA
jgi:predicted dehydrogenase